MEIDKILIANRGEIAVRIIKTAKELGIETVSLYTRGEENLPHVFLADENVYLGDGPLSETYLNVQKIVSAAKGIGAKAIHPGYGFLSEREHFANAVKEAGIKFIGPSSECISLMGDKVESKKRMEKVGIPLIPGYHGDNQEDEFLFEKAKEIGFPVLVKASAGGGGKGMRIVHNENEFIEGLNSAKREAMNAFGDDRVLVEKFIENPRHIEVQVMSDSHGNHLHLFERECSIQRRYQKIIEESPSPFLFDEKRKEICECAVKIASSIDYEGAGTVEFIVDEDQNFYFLEMNTRLQVEHPITEAVTGKDLVNLQILVAKGEKLPFTQDDFKQTGHAIELRIYAEDPDQGFLPQTGKITYINIPENNGVRYDTGYIAGSEVTVDFDPMIAKLIFFGPDRESVINKAKAGLKEYIVGGVKTNTHYLSRILQHKEFISGNTFTHFVKTYEADLSLKEAPKQSLKAALGARCLGLGSKVEKLSKKQNRYNRTWESMGPFRNTPS